MKKGLTEIVFILDKSGSMSGLKKDTIGGFNSLIEKQKKEEGEAYVTTVLFNGGKEILYKRANLKKVEPMTDKQYFVGGGTALLDAVGSTIDFIGTVHEFAREEDLPEHTQFIITTDGMENASRTYSREKIKEMIEEKQKKGWEFMFLGANIDAFQTAREYGIPEYMTANYLADSKGVASVYGNVSDRLCSVRQNKATNDRSWAGTIDADYVERSKK